MVFKCSNEHTLVKSVICGVIFLAFVPKKSDSLELMLNFSQDLILIFLIQGMNCCTFLVNVARLKPFTSDIMG